MSMNEIECKIRELRALPSLADEVQTEMEPLQIVFCTPNALNAADLFQLCYLCRTNHDFVVVQHKPNTLYINQEHPNSAKIAELVRQLWPLKYLDEDGEQGYSLLAEIERLSNADASFLVMRAWRDMRDRVHKANMQARADKWLATYLEPLEVEENDQDLLGAIYNGAGLSAVFAYGYQYGKRDEQHEKT